jgi:hypothetical protein
MKRNTLLVIAVAVAGLFLFINPLQYLRRGATARPAVDKAQVSTLLAWAQDNWRSPQDYVLSAVAGHDIVFLGEFFKIRQNVQLVSDLIPQLYAAGVRNLGIEFALSDDQKEIDALVSAPNWDESRARAVTFDFLVTWGYREYLELYKAAWQINHGLPVGAKHFRVVGLNVRQHWENLKTDRDINDPKVVARIFSDGVPDAHMAEVIDREFIQKGEKALVYCGTQHIFTRYRSSEYEKNAAEMKLAETRRAGNIVYAKIGARAFCISLHAPWPDRAQRGRLAWPAGGAVDALIAALPPDRRSGGWNTAGNPLGALAVTGSDYAIGATGLTLAGLFDGYVVQGPVSAYAAVTPIPDFVRPQDAERASREFPGVKSTPLTRDQVNQSIADDVQAMGKMLTAFK